VMCDGYVIEWCLSDGQIDDALILVAADEVVDEVAVEDGLDDAGHEFYHH